MLLPLNFEAKCLRNMKEGCDPSHGSARVATFGDAQRCAKRDKCRVSCDIFKVRHCTPPQKLQSLQKQMIQPETVALAHLSGSMPPPAAHREKAQKKNFKKTETREPQKLSCTEIGY
jgi:hypothetical protein